jgi:hypothetical protein
VVCGTIAGGDDYEDIVDWAEAHLSFLPGFSEHHGIPCDDWLCVVMNRIDGLVRNLLFVLAELEQLGVESANQFVAVGLKDQRLKALRRAVLGV